MKASIAQLEGRVHAYGGRVQFRPTTKYGKMWLEARHSAKPELLEMKTVNDIDVLHLGAKPEQRGLVGYFKPKQPDLTGLAPDVAKDVQKRAASRQFNAQRGAHMDWAATKAKDKAMKESIIDQHRELTADGKAGEAPVEPGQVGSVYQSYAAPPKPDVPGQDLARVVNEGALGADDGR